MATVAVRMGQSLADRIFRLHTALKDGILTASRIDEPIAELCHAQSSRFAQLLLLPFRWIGVGDMIEEPLLQDVG